MLTQSVAFGSFHNPVKIFFRPGALSELPGVFQAGEVPLIVTDPGIERAGILDRVCRVLDEAGFRYAVFARVESDPSIETVEAAAAFYREKGCGPVIGLGGGSSMDAAKAVAVVVSTGENIRAFRKGPIASPVVPLVAIPTTAGTGSEVTGVMVVSDLQEKVKMVLRGPSLFPKVGILDATLLEGIPSRVAAATGSDAFVHAIEAYLSRKATAVTDALALEAVRLLASNIRRVVADSRDISSLHAMQMGSCMAGLAFSNAGLGLVHALAHPVGAFYHVPHGICCGMFLQPVLRFNLPVCAEKLSQMAVPLGLEAGRENAFSGAKRVIGNLAEIFDEIGIPGNLREMGIPDFQVNDAMLDDAMGAVPRSLNARESTREDLRALFEAVK
ncbi:MAG: iron-containing alcohol dehydrogenase [Synergistaceae bacterium]|jgi:alcohol dehydrogenase class IV|nr:iron-containing alcohol dehydrogenase [Synergistaceae bacterium]